MEGVENTVLVVGVAAVLGVAGGVGGGATTGFGGTTIFFFFFFFGTNTSPGPNRSLG